MSRLKIHDWKGHRREVEFVGYNRDHTACFILNEKGARRAIALYLPDRFDLRFRDKTIAPTSSPPTKISPVAVHLPACFSSQTEEKAYADAKSPQAQATLTAKKDEAWKVLTPHRISLEPKDDKKLLTMWREGGGESAVSVEELRQGYGGVRAKFLCQEWAKIYKVKLEEIPIASRVFRTWLEKQAYRLTRDGEAVSLSLAQWQWAVLEGCIKYQIEFEVGRRCWLNGIEERAVTDPQENEDFDRYEAEALRAEKQKLLAAESALETTKAQNRKEAARLAREHAKQTVSRLQVREALKVKTDRGVWKILRRHEVDKWPERQGELDRLVKKHERRKKTIAEAVGKRNKARAQERRKGRGKDL